jgi:hypothetical protein
MNVTLLVRQYSRSVQSSPTMTPGPTIYESLPAASMEAERRELEEVLAGLSRTPRLAKLLQYVANTYFEGNSDQLTEYNIATEVFGRKKTDFIASEDAIVRVEAHRLRKRLKAYYEAEGKHHHLQISIPLGSYTPVFVSGSTENPPIFNASEEITFTSTNHTYEISEQIADPILEAKEFEPDVPKETSTAALVISAPKRRGWIYMLLAALFFLLVFGIYEIQRTQNVLSGKFSPESALQNSTSLKDGFRSSAASHAAMGAGVSIPFRMIAGYKGPAQKDNSGDVWQQDKYYRNGWPLTSPDIFVARAGDPLIFRYGRAGDFSYNVPLQPGTYELHLYFLQVSETAQSEDEENKAIFNATINGKIALNNFDIVSDAMGRDIADERVFRDVSPAADGMLHLHLSTVVGTPSLSAIEILKGEPNRQLPIRLITQPTPFTDRDGHLWSPDNYFLGGRYLAHNLPSGSSDTDLLSSERYGHFQYAIPADPRDQYTVVLHFEELFFGAKASQGAGSRIFRVMCNGNTLLDNFDIYKEAGSFHMLKKTFYHLKPTAQGKLNLTFEPISNYATVSAIEVLDEAK